eukprot:TRINITY_DN2488_c0_g1_i1.p1 TRINITY_DN2488_c0_g1~~TRINITY_DN2488_c0_g1_i1.p1  ORF type:complete len:637 (-),score=128.87 TRINITY_DN2488_c0_g1_i1:236-2146(-)
MFWQNINDPADVFSQSQHDGMIPELECNRENIFKAPSKCEFVQLNCEYEVFDFLGAYFCAMGSNVAFLLPIGAIYLFCMFHLLASTAENYLAPAITFLSDKFKLSQTLAGVTLLAFANGAPDVISSISAGNTEEGGVSLALGALFGSGLFVTTFVLFRCIVLSPEKQIQANATAMFRDAGFYMLATLYIIALGFVGYINRYHALGFVLLYIIFVAYAVVSDRIEQKKLIQAAAAALLPGRGSNIFSVPAGSERTGSHVSFFLDDDKEFNLRDLKLDSKGIDVSEFNGKPHHINSISKIKSDLTSVVQPNYLIVERRDTFTKRLQVPPQGSNKDNAAIQFARDVNWAMIRVRRNMEQNLKEKNSEFFEKGPIERVLYLYEIPLDFVRGLIIPSVDNFNKYMAIFWPFLSPIAALLFIGKWDDYGRYYYYYLPVACILSGIIWKTSHRNKAPSYQFILSIFSLTMALLTIYISANCIMGFLQLVTIITGLDPTYLGMTMLAWGNSSSDLFTNPALSKEGYGRMAVTGCFAGQLFNFLVGFGASITNRTFKSATGREEFDLFETSKLKDNLIQIVVLGTSVFNFICTLAFSKFNNYMLSRKYGYFLCALYFVFLLGATFIAFRQKINLSVDRVFKDDDS